MTGNWTTQKRWMAALAVAALALYLPGIWWGLPHASVPDPDRFRGVATDELGGMTHLTELHMVFLHKGDSKWFIPQYPLFHYIVEGLFSAPYFAWLKLSGQAADTAGGYPFGISDPIPTIRTFTIFARLPSLLAAVGVVLLAFRTAAARWGETTGRIAGLITLTTYPMFYYARTSNVDMAALFWCALGFALYDACLRDGLTRRRAVLLALTAAAGIGTKDPNYAVFAVMGGVLGVRHVSATLREGRGWAAACATPLYALAVAAAAYVFTSGFLFSPLRFSQHLGFILKGSSGPGRWYGEHAADLVGYLGVTGDTWVRLAQGLGLPMCIAGLAGTAALAARDRQGLLLILPAAGVLLGVIAPVRFCLLRFVVPILYPLGLAAAVVLAQWIASPRRGVRIMGWVWLAGGLLWSGVRGADLTAQMLLDPRDGDLRAWIATNARPGDRLGHYGTARKLPPLEPGIEVVRMPNDLVNEEPPPHAGLRPEFVLCQPERPHPDRYDHWMADADLRAMLDGTAGYRLMLAVQAPSLFDERPLEWVNPPARLFVREDVLPRLVDRAPRIDLPPPPLR